MMLVVCCCSSVTLIIGYQNRKISWKKCIFVVFCRCGEGIFTFSCFVLLMIVRFVWWYLVYHRKSDIIIGNRISIIGNHHRKMLWKRLDSNISHYFLTQKVLKGYPASRVQSSNKDKRRFCPKTPIRQNFRLRLQIIIMLYPISQNFGSH